MDRFSLPIQLRKLVAAFFINEEYGARDGPNGTPGKSAWLKNSSLKTASKIQPIKLLKNRVEATPGIEPG